MSNPKLDFSDMTGKVYIVDGKKKKEVSINDFIPCIIGWAKHQLSENQNTIQLNENGKGVATITLTTKNQ